MRKRRGESSRAQNLKKKIHTTSGRLSYASLLSTGGAYPERPILHISSDCSDARQDIYWESIVMQELAL